MKILFICLIIFLSLKRKVFEAPILERDTCKDGILPDEEDRKTIQRKPEELTPKFIELKR